MKMQTSSLVLAAVLVAGSVGTAVAQGVGGGETTTPNGIGTKPRRIVIVPLGALSASRTFIRAILNSIVFLAPGSSSMFAICGGKIRALSPRAVNSCAKTPSGTTC